MPEKTINIDFYTVSVTEQDNISFDQILKLLDSTPNDESRNFKIRGVPVRLVHAEPMANGNAIIGEMIRIRMDNLPAKASLSGNIESLNLDDDEGVGEETAFFYHVPTRVLVIQRNRTGVSAAQLAHYLSVKGNLDGYVYLDPILERDTMTRYAHMTTVRKLELSLAGQQNAQIFKNLGAGVGATVKMIENLAAPHVSITFSMGHSGGSLATDVVKSLANGVLQIAGDQQSAVTKLRISGKAADESAMPLLDLLEDRMTEQVTVQQDGNRRLTADRRKAAVSQAWLSRKDELTEMFLDNTN